LYFCLAGLLIPSAYFTAPSPVGWSGCATKPHGCRVGWGFRIFFVADKEKFKIDNKLGLQCELS
jgi:hypothetical protein